MKIKSYYSDIVRPLYTDRGADRYLPLARSILFQYKQFKNTVQHRIYPWGEITVSRKNGVHQYAYILLYGVSPYYEYFIANPTEPSSLYAIINNVPGRFLSISKQFKVVHRIGAEVDNPLFNWEIVPPNFTELPKLISKRDWNIDRSPKYVHYNTVANLQRARTVSEYGSLQAYNNPVDPTADPMLESTWTLGSFIYRKTAVGKAVNVYAGGVVYEYNFEFGFDANEVLGECAVHYLEDGTGYVIGITNKFKVVCFPLIPYDELFLNQAAFKKISLPIPFETEIGFVNTYGYRFNSNSNKFCSIYSETFNDFNWSDVVRPVNSGGGFLNIMFRLSQQVGSPPGTFPLRQPIKSKWPILCEWEVVITKIGVLVQNFSIDVQLTTEINDGQYYFVSADYAIENTYLQNTFAVQKDDLVVATMDLYQDDSFPLQNTTLPDTGSELNRNYTWYLFDGGVSKLTFYKWDIVPLAVREIPLSQGASYSTELNDDPSNGYATKEWQAEGQLNFGFARYPLYLSEVTNLDCKTLSITLLKSFFENIFAVQKDRTDVYVLGNKKIFSLATRVGQVLEDIQEFDVERPSITKITGIEKRNLFMSVFGSQFLFDIFGAVSASHRGDISLNTALLKTSVTLNYVDLICIWAEGKLDFNIISHLAKHNQAFNQTRIYADYEVAGKEMIQTWRTWGYWV